LFPEIRFGLHLHTTNRDWYDNINAAYGKGCRRFDTVMHGWGGCPMSGKELLGNLKSENLLAYLDQNHIPIDLDRDALDKAYTLASFLFH
jgi:hydroxymethylglutaryl-CoA lyase